MIGSGLGATSWSEIQQSWVVLNERADKMGIWWSWLGDNFPRFSTKNMLWVLIRNRIDDRDSEVEIWIFGKVCYKNVNEPYHEIMVHFVLRNLILQTCMRSHPEGIDVWFLVRLFVYFHTLCVRTVKALVRLRGCAGSPEPSLVAYVISTIISWPGSNTIICLVCPMQFNEISKNREP